LMVAGDECACHDRPAYFKPEEASCLQRERCTGELWQELTQHSSGATSRLGQS
jgi:hypothetical protein